MVFRFAHIAAYCLGGLALGAAIVTGVPGCSSADVPADAIDIRTSVSQLSGRYEPGSPDTAWLWFDGTSAVKGVNRNGTTLEGIYSIEKVGAGYELVLKLKDGKVSRYAFQPGKTFKAEQQAALGASNLRVRDYCVEGKTCMCDPRNTCNLPYSTPTGNTLTDPLVCLLHSAHSSFHADPARLLRAHGTAKDAAKEGDG